MPLLVAVVLVGLVGAAITLVGVASILQFHGRFSLGVGAMLVLYGLMVLAAAWLGRGRHPLAFGAMTTVSLLHATVIASTANGSDAWWLWPFLVPVIVTLVCLMLPSSREALGRYGRRED